MSTRERAPDDMPQAGQIVTYETLCGMPTDDGRRYEIYGGVLEVSPSPTPWHQIVVLNLAVILQAYVRALGLGEIFIAPLDVIFDPKNVAQPDVLFVARERLSILGPRVSGAPDLAVEVLSRDVAYDRVKKRRQYQKFGVKHFWIVDPEGRTLEEFVLDGGSYRAAAALAGDEEVFRPAIFPDLEVPLAELWTGIQGIQGIQGIPGRPRRRRIR